MAAKNRQNQPRSVQ